MRLDISLAGLVAATGALAHNLFASGLCGSPPPTEQQILATKQLAAEEAARPRLGGVHHFSNSSVVNITIYNHVIAYNKTKEGAYVEMRLLNQVFPKYGFAFHAASTDWVVNASWAGLEDYDSVINMKTALRKGSYADVNLYILPIDGLLGIAAPPMDHVTEGSAEWIWDGVIVTTGSLPGGHLVNYNMGWTAVHEIGHWLGLWHTFQDGCEGDGDFVDDTPAEADAASGCPVGRDSCPDHPGLDPIHNFMDYSFDSCYTEFTPGQAVRMQSSWHRYRAGK